VHPPAVRAEIQGLLGDGLNDCEVARRTGIPRSTVRDIRRGRRRRRAVCPRCWRTGAAAPPSDSDYAELLGLYLGDGHITPLARTERLRLALDAKYPVIVSEAEELLGRCFPDNSVRSLAAHRGSMVVVYVYSCHLTCLLPQHGPGVKHLRPIRLEPWQQRCVDNAPWAFLRGCIRSDGCVFVNRTGRYAYLSYHFANRSSDILELFAGTCRAVGLRPRVYRHQVRLNRRDDVARLLRFVGRKE
jgi:hypothetical protein